MCDKLLNVKMSKLEQVSNWDTRPLRKSQIHYSALDSVITLRLYHRLIELKTEKLDTIIYDIDQSKPVSDDYIND